jgi:hypothetical protein
MNRTEFINWLETKSGFNRKNINSDEYWRELINYAEYIWDELTVEDDKVIFRWEEWKWGSMDYRNREYSFKEFVELYENDELK